MFWAFKPLSFLLSQAVRPDQKLDHQVLQDEREPRKTRKTRRITFRAVQALVIPAKAGIHRFTGSRTNG
jgi:hypothetical protein